RRHFADAVETVLGENLATDADALCLHQLLQFSTQLVRTNGGTSDVLRRRPAICALCRWFAAGVLLHRRLGVQSILLRWLGCLSGTFERPIVLARTTTALISCGGRFRSRGEAACRRSLASRGG